MGERGTERLWNICENQQIGDGNANLAQTEEQRRLALRRKILLKRNGLTQQRMRYDSVLPIIKLLMTVILFYYNYNIFRQIFVKVLETF